MHLIPQKNIANYGRMNNIKIPVAVDYLCPFCNRLISFTSFHWDNFSTEQFASGKCKCPACKEFSKFIYIENKSKGKLKRHELFIYPIPKTKTPLVGFNESKILPKMLQEEYLSALNVYNLREWNASSVICRRLLEGISNTFLPIELHHKSLFQKLEALPKHQNLSEPIIKLAGVIRQGGNKGAHFDENHKPNEKTATLILELIEYLMEYLFILPQRIEHLYEKVTKRKKTL